MTRFIPNPNLAAALEPEVRRAVTTAVEPARRFAAAMAEGARAPWMPRGPGPTIVVDQSLDGVRLVNRDYAGHLVEWGSANNPPHAPLRRGVRAAGLRLVEK